MNNDMDLFDDVDFGDVELGGETPNNNSETVKIEVLGETVEANKELVEQVHQEAKVSEELTTGENLDVDNFFNELGVKDDKASVKKKTDVKKPEPKEESFSGPRPVMVYGQELWVEEDTKVSLESIRQRIVDEFMFPEFSKERTHMSFDKDTGIIVPVISFQKKG